MRLFRELPSCSLVRIHRPFPTNRSNVSKISSHPDIFNLNQPKPNSVTGRQFLSQLCGFHPPTQLTRTGFLRTPAWYSLHHILVVYEQWNLFSERLWGDREDWNHVHNSLRLAGAWVLLSLDPAPWVRLKRCDPRPTYGYLEEGGCADMSCGQAVMPE